jgi:hypothetical protein
MRILHQRPKRNNQLPKSQLFKSTHRDIGQHTYPSAHSGAGGTSKGRETTVVVFGRVCEFVNHLVLWPDNETDLVVFRDEEAVAVEGGGPLFNLLEWGLWFSAKH